MGAVLFQKIIYYMYILDEVALDVIVQIIDQDDEFRSHNRISVRDFQTP